MPGRLLGPLAAVVVAMPFSGSAQLLNNPGDNSPVEIQADSGIEWQQQTQVYIARGHAVAKRGTSELHADTLVAHYRQSKGGAAPAASAAGGLAGNTAGNTEIFRVEADGHVLIKREAQQVTGDKAVYDIDQSVVVMTGKELKLITATDMVTARDSLEWYEQKQIAVARGDAVAIRNGKTIKADILTAYMSKSQPGGAPAAAGKAKPVAKPVTAQPGKPGTPGGDDSKINRVDAQGHVVVTNGADTGRSDYGVYNAATGIATLVGNVAISRAKDVIRGQSAVMDMNNNVSRMLPTANLPGTPQQRVQGLFVREDAASRNAAKPAAAPASGKSP